MQQDAHSFMQLAQSISMNHDKGRPVNWQNPDLTQGLFSSPTCPFQLFNEAFEGCFFRLWNMGPSDGSHDKFQQKNVMLSHVTDLLLPPIGWKMFFLPFFTTELRFHVFFFTGAHRTSWDGVGSAHITAFVVFVAGRKVGCSCGQDRGEQQKARDVPAIHSTERFRKSIELLHPPKRTLEHDITPNITRIIFQTSIFGFMLVFRGVYVWKWLWFLASFISDSGFRCFPGGIWLLLPILVGCKATQLKSMDLEVPSWSVRPESANVTAWFHWRKRCFHLKVHHSA